MSHESIVRCTNKEREEKIMTRRVLSPARCTFYDSAFGFS